MTNAIAGAEVRCDGVSMVFERESDSLTALHDVSFRVRSGEFVSLLGPSGCGKSSLLRIIDGLMPASAGTVAIDGRVVDRPGPDRAYVFQSDSLLPWRSIERNVRFGLDMRGVPADQAKAEAKRLLGVTGLADFADRYPHELSGGMRQRANLARALAVDPQVLLMDEPFAALDAQTREVMQAEVLRLWRASRRTVLFVTHSIEEAVYMSDRVLIMTPRPGRVRMELPIELPRPRSMEARRTPEFAQIARDLWEILKNDVLAGI